jgi:hypothetical protein
MKPTSCPVCQAAAPVESVQSQSGALVGGRSFVRCSSCGDYLLHERALRLLEKSTPETRREVARLIAEERRNYPDVLPEVSEGLVLLARR